MHSGCDEILRSVGFQGEDRPNLTNRRSREIQDLAAVLLTERAKHGSVDKVELLKDRYDGRAESTPRAVRIDNCNAEAALRHGEADQPLGAELGDNTTTCQAHE